MNSREANTTLAAVDNVVMLDVRGFSTLAIQVVGSMNATLLIEGTVNGKDFFALNAIPRNSSTSVTSITAAGVWLANVAGLLAARVRCSVYTSGTPTIALRAVENGLAEAAGLLPSTGEIVIGGVSYEVKYAKANIAASQTDSALVTAVANKRIRVISFRVMAGATATDVTFNTKPGGAGTAISELMACGANGGQHGAYNPTGHFQTSSGEGLSVTTGTGSTVGIGISYIEV